MVPPPIFAAAYRTSDEERTATFFDNGQGLWRVVMVGTAAYAALVMVVRLSGKRTPAKLSAFDLVVLLTKGVALFEGIVALALLALLQLSLPGVRAASPLSPSCFPPDRAEA